MAPSVCKLGVKEFGCRETCLERRRRGCALRTVTGLAIEAGLDQGDYLFIVSFPPRFEKDVLAGHQPEVQVLVDANGISCVLLLCRSCVYAIPVCRRDPRVVPNLR